MQLVGPDGKQRNYQEGTPLVDIAPDYQAAYDTPIALGVLNGREVPLQMIPQEGDRICFLDMNSVESYNTYISTFLFVLIAAMNRARPQVMLCRIRLAMHFIATSRIRLSSAITTWPMWLPR